MDEEIFGTGAEDMTEDKPMPIIFPDDESPDESVNSDSITDNFDDDLDGGLEDDFPDSDEVAGLRDEATDTPDTQPKQQVKEPEPEQEIESQPEEPTEEKPEEQPEEHAKKKLWDTIRKGLSDFTKRFKREQDVKAEIVESQNQGLEPVSKEKQPEEKQLSPEEIMKIDACTAIMMAHLKDHSISYTPETVKNIVQNALTTYAAALGSDRLLGGFRDASTTKRLISDVMSGITTDIQKEFGEQPIKVTVTASLGREEMRTIAKQMYSVLKIPNDDDHLGNSIRTTLDEIPNIKVPLTVSYKELLEEKKNHETIIENNKTNISDLKEKIKEQKKSLEDAKKKFKAETGLDYDEITASKAPNTPDTPDYSKILRPEYSELFEQCALLSSNLNGLNKSLEDQGRVDLPNINDDDKKIRDMEEQLQKLGVSGITEFINKLNPIAVSSEEIPAPENPYSPELKEVFADGQSQNDGATTEQHEVNDPASATTPATDGQDGATELSDPATPLDPTPETPVTEESASAAAESASAAAESASAAAESASAAEESASAAEESASAAAESASAAEESASAAENQGQGQDDAETASATAEQLKVNDNAQSEEKSDSDDLESAPATTPESDENRESKETKTQRTETMAKDGRDLTVNNAGSKAAAEAEAEAARQAAASTETKAAAQPGKKNDHGHGHK